MKSLNYTKKSITDVIHKALRKQINNIFGGLFLPFNLCDTYSQSAGTVNREKNERQQKIAEICDDNGSVCVGSCVLP